MIAYRPFSGRVLALSMEVCYDQDGSQKVTGTERLCAPFGSFFDSEPEVTRKVPASLVIQEAIKWWEYNLGRQNIDYFVE